MIANFLHCVIANPSLGDSHLDYVNPLYSGNGESESEKMVRAILLGHNNPSSESRLFSSVTIRSHISRGPFSAIGNRFGVEGGWPLKALRDSLFDAYKLVADPQITVSGNAIKYKLPTYAVHKLICQVSNEAVSVSNRSYGMSFGAVDQPIRVPGMESTATVTVSGPDGQYTAAWATRPSVSHGSIAETLATTGRPSLLTLQTTSGLLFQDEREALMRCVMTGAVAIDRVSAAALLLANAAYTRLGFI